jgi:hypothetical protein
MTGRDLERLSFSKAARSGAGGVTIRKGWSLTEGGR